MDFPRSSSLIGDSRSRCSLINWRKSIRESRASRIDIPHSNEIKTRASCEPLRWTENLSRRRSSAAILPTDRAVSQIPVSRGRYHARAVTLTERELSTRRRRGQRGKGPIRVRALEATRRMQIVAQIVLNDAVLRVCRMIGEVGAQRVARVANPDEMLAHVLRHLRQVLGANSRRTLLTRAFLDSALATGDCRRWTMNGLSRYLM